jgi:hypothetical protein
VLLCLLAGGCASQRVAGPTATAGHGGDGLVAVRWQLTQVRDPDGTFAIPASLDSWFEATSGYAVQGDDGCSFFDGTGHRSAQGFTVSDVITAANGCAGGPGPLDAAINGFGHVLNGQHSRVWLSGTELRLTAGRYALVFTSAKLRATTASLPPEPARAAGSEDTANELTPASHGKD